MMFHMKTIIKCHIKERVNAFVVTTVVSTYFTSNLVKFKAISTIYGAHLYYLAMPPKSRKVKINFK